MLYDKYLPDGGDGWGKASSGKSTGGNASGGLAALKAGLGFVQSVGGVPKEYGILAEYMMDKASGDKNAEREALTNAGKYAVSEYAMPSVMEKLGSGAAVPASLASGVLFESFKENPDYGAAATRSTFGSLGALIGSALGPVGTLVGSAVGQMVGGDQYRDGILGDGLDSRTYERVRDFYEDRGVSRSETSGFAKELDDAVSTDMKQFGKEREYFNGKEKSFSLGNMIGGLFSGSGSDNSSGSSGDFGDRESSPGGMGGV